MNLWKESRWFAVHTKAQREAFAAASVMAFGIPTLLPRLKVERLIRGVPRVTTRTLFPGYLFARFCPEKSLESVGSARGVLQVVSSGRFPIPIDDEVVSEIRDRIGEDGLIRTRPDILAPGTRVSIQSGPFEGMMGRVEHELDDRKRVAILLDSLLNARAQIEKRWLQAEAG